MNKRNGSYVVEFSWKKQPKVSNHNKSANISHTKTMIPVKDGENEELPWNTVCLIVTKWINNPIETYSTGCLIGRNAVLTSAFSIYNPVKCKVKPEAEKIWVIPAYHEKNEPYGRHLVYNIWYDHNFQRRPVEGGQFDYAVLKLGTYVEGVEPMPMFLTADEGALEEAPIDVVGFQSPQPGKHSSRMTKNAGVIIKNRVKAPRFQHNAEVIGSLGSPIFTYSVIDQVFKFIGLHVNDHPRDKRYYHAFYFDNFVHSRITSWLDQINKS